MRERLSRTKRRRRIIDIWSQVYPQLARAGNRNPRLHEIPLPQPEK
jgi:hypothetical protein